MNYRGEKIIQSRDYNVKQLCAFFNELLGKDQKWTLVKLKSGHLGEFLMESSKVDTWEFCCGESERMNHFILIPDTDLDGIRS